MSTLGIFLGLVLFVVGFDIYRRLSRLFEKKYEIKRPPVYYVFCWTGSPPTAAKTVPEEEKDPPNNT